MHKMCCFRCYQEAARSEDSMSLAKDSDMLLPVRARVGAQRDIGEQYQ